MPTALRALAACAILPQLAFVRAGDAVGREGSWWHPTAVRNWCDELLAHPLAASCWCRPNRTDVLATGSRYPRRMERAGQRAGEHPIDRWARDAHGAATFNAQYGQDWWIFSNLIANGLLPWHGGTYVDLAANDAIFRSSTYFLDACLGWKGACVEANPAHYYGIFQQRTCQLVPACASDGQRHVSLALDKRDPTGGSSTLERASHHQHPQRRRGGEQDATWQEVTVACDTLTSMLERLGHRHIDVLSLDVEGHEPAVLAGLNFSRISVSVLLLEPTCSRSPQMRAACHQMRAHGFTQLADQGILDTVWVHQSLTATKPKRAYQKHRCRRLGKGTCRGWNFEPSAVSDYANALGVRPAHMRQNAATESKARS